MPSTGSSPEAAAIEAAYGAQIQLLFSKLVTNIVDEPTTHDTDQQSLDRFTAIPVLRSNRETGRRRLALSGFSSMS